MLVFVSVSLLSFRSGSAPGHLVSLLNFEEAMTQIRNVEEPWYPTQRGGGGVGFAAPPRPPRPAAPPPVVRSTYQYHGATSRYPPENKQGHGHVLRRGHRGRGLGRSIW
jgi:hypothetical protein